LNLKIKKKEGGTKRRSLQELHQKTMGHLPQPPTGSTSMTVPPLFIDLSQQKSKKKAHWWNHPLPVPRKPFSMEWIIPEIQPHPQPILPYPQTPFIFAPPATYPSSTVFVGHPQSETPPIAKKLKKILKLDPIPIFHQAKRKEGELPPNAPKRRKPPVVLPQTISSLGTLKLKKSHPNLEGEYPIKQSLYEPASVKNVSGDLLVPPQLKNIPPILNPVPLVRGVKRSASKLSLATNVSVPRVILSPVPETSSSSLSIGYERETYPKHLKENIGPIIRPKREEPVRKRQRNEKYDYLQSVANRVQPDYFRPMTIIRSSLKEPLKKELKISKLKKYKMPKTLPITFTTYLKPRPKPLYLEAIPTFTTHLKPRPKPFYVEAIPTPLPPVYREPKQRAIKLKLQTKELKDPRIHPGYYSGKTVATSLIVGGSPIKRIPPETTEQLEASVPSPTTFQGSRKFFKQFQEKTLNWDISLPPIPELDLEHLNYLDQLSRGPKEKPRGMSYHPGLFANDPKDPNWIAHQQAVKEMETEEIKMKQKNPLLQTIVTGSQIPSSLKYSKKPMKMAPPIGYPNIRTMNLRPLQQTKKLIGVSKPLNPRQKLLRKTFSVPYLTSKSTIQPLLHRRLASNLS